MPLPARFQALFDDKAHRFAQRKNQGNRGRVMIQPVFAPVIHRGRQVEIPALHFRLALAEDFFGGRTHRDRRHSGGRADGLLRSAEANINALLIHIDWHSCERRHGIHNQQRTQFVRNLAVRIDTGNHASGSFPVREADNLDFFALACASHIFHVHRLSVRRFHLYYFRRSPRRNFVHAFGENAIDRNDGFVALFQGVKDGCFNPARTGSRKRHGDAVFRLKNLPQEDLRFVHAPFEPGVHVTHQRRGHGAIDARVDGRRSGSQH